VGIEVAEQIADVLQGGVIRNAVNMPSLDAAALKTLGPYMELGQSLGALVQQIGPKQIASLNITYWGRVVDLDANAITRAIQRGFLRRISGEAINYVNAPVALKRLGVQSKVLKSTDEVDYTELICVEAVAPDGTTAAAKGTLVGKTGKARVVEINNREVEVEAVGKLLIIENQDQPGMIGYVGSLLGRDRVNIANMSLSRTGPGETALIVINLDSEPSEETRAELKANPAITLAKFVQV